MVKHSSNLLLFVKKIVVNIQMHHILFQFHCVSMCDYGGVAWIRGVLGNIYYLFNKGVLGREILRVFFVDTGNVGVHSL